MELVWVLIIVVGFWLCVQLLRWGLPFLLKRMVKRMMRKRFGIDLSEPAQPKRPKKPFFSAGPAPKPRPRGKKIPRDVGEYVEFEEFSSSYQYTASDGTRFKAEEQVVDVKWKDLN